MSRNELIATAFDRTASAIPATHVLATLLAANAGLLVLLDAHGLVPRWLESAVALFLLF